MLLDQKTASFCSAFQTSDRVERREVAVPASNPYDATTKKLEPKICRMITFFSIITIIITAISIIIDPLIIMWDGYTCPSGQRVWLSASNRPKRPATNGVNVRRVPLCTTTMQEGARPLHKRRLSDEVWQDSESCHTISPYLM